MKIWSAFQKNKLGKTLKDYQCPDCGSYHVSSFMNHRILRKCRRCGYEFLKIAQAILLKK